MVLRRLSNTIKYILKKLKGSQVSRDIQTLDRVPVPPNRKCLDNLQTQAIWMYPNRWSALQQTLWNLNLITMLKLWKVDWSIGSFGTECFCLSISLLLHIIITCEQDINMSELHYLVQRLRSSLEGVLNLLPVENYSFNLWAADSHPSLFTFGKKTKVKLFDFRVSMFVISENVLAWCPVASISSSLYWTAFKKHI